MRAPEALRWLERHGNARTRDLMLPKYGITAKKAFGVPVGTIHHLAKKIGRDHALALVLWKTGCYEARLLSAFIDEPERVTPAQMDAWARDFDSWAVCDTVCFHLFDRTPLAWKKIAPWCRRRDEFVRRAGFALLASLALHDKSAGDGVFLRALPLVECGARGRAQLREEGGELGAARDRPAQPRPPRGGGRRGAAAGGVSRRGRPLGG
jgi:3-methyladenine DNA glycosylase AlkD